MPPPSRFTEKGFVAAFCGGLAFGATAGRRGPAELVFLEQASGLVSLLGAIVKTCG
jgi:hypothetical protein